MHQPILLITHQILMFPRAHLLIRNFNPRAQVGCDQDSGAYWASIVSFQSTHPGRVRLDLACGVGVTRWRFQSTHPGRVRHSWPYLPTNRVYFNPRTQVGCDECVLAEDVDTGAISIHAPR